MKYKELINAELSQLGFNEIIYYGATYSELINKINNNIANNQIIEEVKLNKSCLVSGIKFINTEDQRTILFNISFIDIANNCKNILDTLLNSNYSGDIAPINEEINTNEFQLHINIERGK